ncbi:ferredoxin [Mycolicibacterium diernhoferi]|uniref:Ferredoxin n=1 Tax=Mycolicibacterium diernhoferi TaxID=1801 RepID=A0A1Q4HJ28_9MYCO|nr:ferredoxin [Mycolicibacterium diernhoferi]OJZ67401.1 ferredoxin [Mycolicibacterium diernhoferi]OPE45949.1 ferredoxin [Mycolicibacterium diernhoferi]PEG54929.1 ferredoxin [Mycolicibacterium diernhoferi]QYL25043.1 ferredoxin [Mycolicibacterium diernhoferi]
MIATVDDDACAGHGVCVALCPEVFTLTDDGYAQAVGTEVPAQFHEVVTEAAASCPERAIHLKEES